MAGRSGSVYVGEVRGLLEEAGRLLEEGRALVERDPVKACERLYEAAEAVMRAVADALGVEAPPGRWSADTWLGVIRRARRELDKDLSDSLFNLWTAAEMLLIEGAYEGHLTPKDINHLLKYVETAFLKTSLWVKETYKQILR